MGSGTRKGEEVVSDGSRGRVEVGISFLGGLTTTPGKIGASRASIGTRKGGEAVLDGRRGRSEAETQNKQISHKNLNSKITGIINLPAKMATLHQILGSRQPQEKKARAHETQQELSLIHI